MEQGPKREIIKIIQSMLTRRDGISSQIIAVNANHTLANFPNTTTAITTGATAMPTTTPISLTAKGSGSSVAPGGLPGTRVRVLIAGAINALNTLQAVITPTLSFTANGANTVTAATLQAFALPGNTSSPMVGMISWIAEVTNTLWAAGQTITATLSLTGSATGGSAPLGALTLSMQEIF
jgi:hypothetical protein